MSNESTPGALGSNDQLGVQPERVTAEWQRGYNEGYEAGSRDEKMITECAIRSALMEGLSGTQEWALDWLRKNGPAPRREWRNAGIAARTMSSLVHRGLAATDDQRRAFAQW